jgi:hypothetical protein
VDQEVRVDPDPEAQLARRGNGNEAKLIYTGDLLMENQWFDHAGHERASGRRSGIGTVDYAAHSAENGTERRPLSKPVPSGMRGL